MTRVRCRCSIKPSINIESCREAYLILFVASGKLSQLMEILTGTVFSEQINRLLIDREKSYCLTVSQLSLTAGGDGTHLVNKIFGIV